MEITLTQLLVFILKVKDDLNSEVVIEKHYTCDKLEGHLCILDGLA